MRDYQGGQEDLTAEKSGSVQVGVQAVRGRPLSVGRSLIPNWTKLRPKSAPSSQEREFVHAPPESASEKPPATKIICFTHHGISINYHKALLFIYLITVFLELLLYWLFVCFIETVVSILCESCGDLELK